MEERERKRKVATFPFYFFLCCFSNENVTSKSIWERRSSRDIKKENVGREKN